MDFVGVYQKSHHTEGEIPSDLMDRYGELEARRSELQSSCDGLEQELDHCKRKIKSLERELENWESKMSKEVSTMTKCYNSLRVSEIDNEQLEKNEARKSLRRTMKLQLIIKSVESLCRKAIDELCSVGHRKDTFRKHMPADPVDKLTTFGRILTQYISIEKEWRQLKEAEAKRKKRAEARNDKQHALPTAASSGNLLMAEMKRNTASFSSSEGSRSDMAVRLLLFLFACSPPSCGHSCMVLCL